MDAFLQQIARGVTKEKLPYLYSSCYIFPTRRASLYFLQYLQEAFPDETFILPATCTIQEFILKYTRYAVEAEWPLLARLHAIQTRLTGTAQPFEKFLPWGRMILKDFDECDKYLVDAANLFSVLRSQKEMEERFPLSDETRALIERILITEGDKSSRYKEEFIKTWNLLGDMHRLFREELETEQLAYEGMAYRDVYAQLKAQTLRLPYTDIQFCGFNALSVCEEAIFRELEDQYNCIFWWDTDDLFMDNPLHEAGNFMRHYREVFQGKHHHWIGGSSLSSGKTITITGIASNAAQAQYVAHALQEHLPAPGERTAIVLCDENLLSPLLHGLDTSSVNITMGYPIHHSEWFIYLNSLLSFYCRARRGNHGTDYYHKDIHSLLRHPYLSARVQNTEKLEEILPFFVPFMPESVLESYFPASFFPAPADESSLLGHLIQLLNEVSSADAATYPLREVLCDSLRELGQLFRQTGLAVELKALPQLVRAYLAGSRVPFNKPASESSVQVMGFLETRLLDFDQLYILSLNDDKLPGTNKTNSFIPYNLRKAFGLPTFEQFDGINAYHFYRLLKRAGNIHLVYNNQSGDNTSERSRFIRQIEHDLTTPDNTIQEILAVPERAAPDSASSTTALRIPKTSEMTAALRQRIFSPSALKIYLQCPVQFYLKYVASIQEPEVPEEDMDAALFGRLLHHTLQLIYEQHLQANWQAEDIRAFTRTNGIAQAIEKAIAAMKLPKEMVQGGNRLQLTIIERIVEKMLENDAQEGVIHVLHTESKFVWDALDLADSSKVVLQGTFDRVDQLEGGSVRILDYKTGRVRLPEFPKSEDEISVFLDTLFTYSPGKDYSAAFQGILYALIYYRLTGCRSIHVGYHLARQMKEGIVYLNEGNALPLTLLEQFEQRLSDLLSDLIYRIPYFEQNLQEGAYDYSPYAEVLGME